MVNDEIKNNEITTQAYTCNVADKIKLSLVVSEILKEYHTIDILINNANIKWAAEFLHFDDEHIEAILNVNLMSYFRVSTR